MAGKEEEQEPDINDVMNDLELRFILNLPEEEFSSADRLFFQLEQAHWFYEDFYADLYPSLPHLRLHAFAKEMFEHCEFLVPHQGMYKELFDTFAQYKSQVPVYGLIMLNPTQDKLVLVKSYNGKTWSFPKGKINQGEGPVECAIRETMEETGYNAVGKVNPDDYIQVVQDGKPKVLFIAKDVPEDTEFAPQTRKEISAVGWHSIENITVKTWMVNVYLPKLKRFIRMQSKQSKGRGRSQSTARQQYDDALTFGADGSQGWDVEAMFAANAKLTGRQFVYDGNPHTFGTQGSAATPKLPSKPTRMRSLGIQYIPVEQLFAKAAKNQPESSQATADVWAEGARPRFRFNVQNIMETYDNTVATTVIGITR